MKIYSPELEENGLKSGEVADNLLACNGKRKIKEVMGSVRKE